LGVCISGTRPVLVAVFGGGSVKEHITDAEQSSQRAIINLLKVLKCDTCIKLRTEFL
jgi:hypothetical protein